MLLHDLELVGFKSFGEKIRLRFDPAFTAVVGPNGSGKSNVVDAIRWLLGEQSHKQLRTPDSSEILFQGEKGEDRMNFAEVTMTLVPSKGEEFFAGTGKSTLAIGRRYERDGSNHYLINGQKSRLKDLRLTLAEHGFGLNAMSILSQGRIDAVLSLQPEERRVILEEVAQVHGFQLNKQKTLEKIAQTNENLHRLEDVLREVNERMAELAQQALAARRHHELTDARVERERWLTGRDLDRRAAAAVTLRRELRDAEAAAATYRDQVRDTKAQLAESEVIAQDCSGQLTTHLERQAELAVAATEARSVTTQLTERERELRERLGDLTRRGEALRVRIADLEQSTTAQEFELAETQRHAEQAEGRRAELASSYAGQAEALRLAEQQWETARASREDLLGRQRRLEQQVAVGGERLLAARRGLAETADERKRLLSRLDELTEVLAEQRSAVATASTAVSEAEAGVSGAQTALRAAQMAAGEAQSQLSHQTTLLAAREAELRTIEALEKGWEGYQAGVRALMEGVEKGLVPSDLALLVDELHVESDYAVAVEAALDHLSQLVVTGSWQTAEVALDYLKREGLGRVALGVLEQAATLPAPTRDLPGLGEIALIPLAQCVRGHGTRAALVEQLIQGIAVAPSLAEARRAQGAGYRGLLVTRQGELLHPWGGVTGGSAEALTAGMVVRRGRREELAAGIATVREDAATASDTLEAAQQQHRIEEVAVATKQQVLATAREALNESQRTLTQTTQTAEQIRAQESHLQSRMVALEAQTTALDQEQRETESQLNEVANQLLGLGGAPGADRDLQRLREDVGVLQQTLHAAQLRAQELRARMQELERSLQRGREELTRANAELAPLTTEREPLQRILDDLSEKAPQVREAEAATVRQLEAARAEEKRIRTRLDEAVHQVSSAKSDLVGLEGDLAQAGGERESLSIRLARAEADVDALSTQMKEDHWFRETFPGLTEDPLGLLQTEGWKAFIAPAPPAAQLRRELAELDQQLLELGEINTLAARDYGHYEERHGTLKTQREDLLGAIGDLEQSLKEIERKSRIALEEVFELTKANFQQVFAELFPGGEARLHWSDPEHILESGLEIGVHFPGKGERHLMQFSGGERTLIAIAFLFAVLQAKPPTFVILDEVEAALDDANVEKFLHLVNLYKDTFQFVVITHNKLTMEHAPELYGVTMRKGGCSQVVSVRVQEWITEHGEESREAVAVG